ncbi:prepilin peptidase [Actinokineospora terrae]|uniref:Leader peptidase (Prepilin peptidase) / N-methyltransferase n=1 Tax=Actinokineospora terrae TaxID=155974 RepID=A0A1H9Q257_9PSEU|nr:A24 family peptidase [Actinokineospora terrae]SER54494.1 leader peptidase (prepilin peptidase) / N-methyltransferase [Actinokineospora terrae]
MPTQSLFSFHLTPSASPPTRLPALAALLAATALCLPLPALFHGIALSTVAAIAGYAIGAAVRLLVPEYAVPARWFELATAALWSVLAATWSAGIIPGWWLPAIAFLATLSVPLAVVDLLHQRLPNRLTLPAFPLAVALFVPAALSTPNPLLQDALTGAILATAFFALVTSLNPSALGMGDVKLAPILGLYLGPGGPLSLILAPLLASAVTLFLHLLRHPAWHARIPFAPGLLAATFALFPLSAS